MVLNDKLQEDVFLELLPFLQINEIPNLLLASKLCLQTIDNSEYSYIQLFNRYALKMTYIPKGFQLKGMGSSRLKEYWEKRRKEIMSTHSVKELKIKLLTSGVNRVSIANCYEKVEMASLLVENEEGKISFVESLSPSIQTTAPIPSPHTPSECLAKKALRMSVVDRTRSYITAAELTSLTFYIRVRTDGHFQELVPGDPYSRGIGMGKVQFHPASNNYKLEWTWPTDPTTGELCNPFASMGEEAFDSTTWNLSDNGKIVQLLFNGGAGPQENVIRHPKNGGWILYSGATIWTSFEYSIDEPDLYATEKFLNTRGKWNVYG